MIWMSSESLLDSEFAEKLTGVSPVVCSTMSEFHLLFVLRCQSFTCCLFYDVRVSPVVCSTMSILKSFNTSAASFSYDINSLFSYKIRLSLLNFHYSLNTV